MSYPELIRIIGFDRDPFATTNADEEDLLEDYFIEPPFFKAVYGDIRQPKSVIVFAPRGGGKTALKRRIELSSRSDAFLCITYNSFPTAGLRLANINQEFHLKNIARIMLVGVLSAATNIGIEKLNSDDRHFLFLLAKAHFTDLDATSLKESIAAVKNISDKAREMWNKLTGPIGVVLNAALCHFGFKPAEISKFEEINARIGNFQEQIQLLARLALSFGFFSTYILVDKIDETNLTGNKASASLAFVQPLISDLSLLETRNLGFKFFLWDLMADDASRITRPDRVKHYSLQWSRPQLTDMLSKRLAAHSQKRIHSLSQISDFDGKLQLDEIIVALSAGSPRNIIRICKAIFDQQSEINAGASKISQEAILRGIQLISGELAGEVVPANVLKDLQKLKRADFTVRNIYADVFKITQAAGLTKVQTWQDNGAAVKIGSRQEKRGNRPSNHYAISNPIVLKYIFSDVNVKDFFEKKIRFCECGQIALRDWDLGTVHSCHACQKELIA